MDDLAFAANESKTRAVCLKIMRTRRTARLMDFLCIKYSAVYNI